ncbi:hypothetical protein PoB_000881100 [Plakobranchus ocellatus]|uniref:Uncharacterized protein n=1 Tax=Plakobranchus ocellatus TaxID=259542 RepID=A0AAV3YGK1_9GAST|nr:hypothetical protein PoB_000881100 [Plakobranchus ocellatus]
MCLIQTHILHNKYLASKGERCFRLKVFVKRLGTELANRYYQCCTEEPDGRNIVLAVPIKDDMCLYISFFNECSALPHRFDQLKTARCVLTSTRSKPVQRSPGNESRLHTGAGGAKWHFVLRHTSRCITSKRTTVDY